MSETEAKSPFGRGFVAACIVIAATLACGAILLITSLTSDNSPTTTPPAPATSGVEARPGAGSRGASPDGEAGGQPTGSASPGGQPTGAGTEDRCGVPDGDQTSPSDKAPTADGWEVSRRAVVPRSSAYGPAKTDADGFRHCFAHSPTGAVYAAYNVIAALADQSKAAGTVGKLMVAGRDTDALLREVRKETADTTSSPPQIAGYRVVDASRDRVTVMLAMPVQTEYMSATFTLTWQAGDWRLVPPSDGGSVGTPYAQHRTLNDFVAWSGV